VATFQILQGQLAELLGQVNRHSPRPQFLAAQEAHPLLRNCIALLTEEQALTPRWATLLVNCQASARLVAEALSSPLLPQDKIQDTLVQAKKLTDYLPAFQISLESATRLAPRTRGRYAYEVRALTRQVGDGSINELSPDTLVEWTPASKRPGPLP